MTVIVTRRQLPDQQVIRPGKALTAILSHPLLRKADALILDLLDEPYSVPHILSAVQQLRSAWPQLPVTVLLAGPPEAHKALEQIFGCRVSRDMAVLTAQSRAAAAAQPDDAATGESSAEGVPDLAAVRQIALASAVPRSGVTTQAVAVCRTLQRWGAWPVLREARRRLAKEDGILCQAAGLSVCTMGTALPRGCIVVDDLGAVGDQAQLQDVQYQYLLLVTGSKPWEFTALARLLGGMSRSRCSAVLVSWPDDRGLEIVREAVRRPTYPVPYRPDLLCAEPQEGLDVFLRSILQEEKK